MLRSLVEGCPGTSIGCSENSVHFAFLLADGLGFALVWGSRSMQFLCAHFAVPFASHLLLRLRDLLR